MAGVAAGQAGFADEATPDLVMKYVPVLADVMVGDVVVTSGLDRIYPKGLVVGRVRAVGQGRASSRRSCVEPSARFATLEEVLVVTGPRPSSDRATGGTR